MDVAQNGVWKQSDLFKISVGKKQTITVDSADVVDSVFVLSCRQITGWIQNFQVWNLLTLLYPLVRTFFTFVRNRSLTKNVGSNFDRYPAKGASTGARSRNDEIAIKNSMPRERSSVAVTLEKMSSYSKKVEEKSFMLTSGLECCRGVRNSVDQCMSVASCSRQTPVGRVRGCQSLPHHLDRSAAWWSSKESELAPAASHLD